MKLEGYFQNDSFILESNDTRLFRGWETLEIEINLQFYTLCEIAPGYYRKAGCKIPPELLRQLSVLENDITSINRYNYKFFHLM